MDKVEKIYNRYLLDLGMTKEHMNIDIEANIVNLTDK